MARKLGEDNGHIIIKRVGQKAERQTDIWKLRQSKKENWNLRKVK